jgi:hypothetical protein
MALRLRLVVRYLRMLIACAVLGVLAPPPAPAAACVDTVTWVTRVAVAGATDRSPSTRAHGIERDAPQPRAAHVDPRSSSPALWPARVAPPPGARAIVVHRRVYLRNASLLC